MNEQLNFYTSFIKEAKPIKSRLGTCHEVLGFSTSISSGIVRTRNGFNSRLAMTEAWSMLSGIYHPEMFNIVANLKADFSWPHAYGLKFAQQIRGVIQQLKDNPETRRAIIHIGQPSDGYETEKPCVQSYQFMLRNSFLETFLVMRSWDLWLGFPYDTAVANLISACVARELGVAVLPGNLHCYASSAHIYEKDVDKILDVESRTYNVLPPQMYHGWDNMVFEISYQLSPIFDDYSFTLSSDEVPYLKRIK